ncbi:MAG TPA: alanine--tRNA ligase [Herpetosiphonaceae bacterium]
MPKPWTTNEIRQTFLDFFKKHHHAIVASSSLVPSNDPTLLFVNAGMVQFKDVFLGVESRSYTRAATVQKCMRVSGKHNDLENVGPSPRHHTFFEMLGNFSFGDYFKKEAIPMAYDLMVNGYGLDPARLYYTIYPDDQESFDIWSKDLGINPDRIFRMEGNFWRMADVGPCGPNSEIIYDRGPEGCTCGDPNCSIELDNDCDRWLEVWNLVFMQFSQEASGEMTPLPKPGVDTGMGLERLVSVIQDKPDNYQTDLFTPIFEKLKALLGHTDEHFAEHLVGYRVIADHTRAATFLIADGVLPGNVGRDYVLRLILRRALRYGKMIGFTGPFIAEVARVVIEQMGGHYTELRERADFIIAALQREEAAFQQTLDRGIMLLDELIGDLRKRGSTVIPGERAFQLYSTFGFPYDLINDVAKEHGLTIDRQAYDRAMLEEKTRSKAASSFNVDTWIEHYRRMASELPTSEFLGYDYEHLREVPVQVLAIIDPETGERLEQGAEGSAIDLLLNRTPFYAESGGQVADTGVIETEYGRAIVEDVQKPIPNVIVHRARIVSGTIRRGENARATVDVERRWDVMRNHTATHLLHRALRTVLGEHAQQRGSLVAPGYLRFDFNHLQKLTDEELAAIEREVNEHILNDLPVGADETSLDEARQRGAMMLFGEKYGDTVRMVSIDDQPQAQRVYSRELCGGTHVRQTGQIGPMLITNEQSISQGVRRIVALTGHAAEEYIASQKQLLQAIGRQLGVQEPEKIKERVEQLQEERNQLARQLQALQSELLRKQLETALKDAQQVDNISVLAVQVNAGNVEQMREMSDWLRDKLGTAFVVLGAVLNGKVLLTAAATRDVVARGISAGKVVQQIAKIVGGSGGGRPDFAQAGGPDAPKLPEALAKVAALVEEQVGSASRVS